MRILVVEDDSIFGLLIERVLKPYLWEGDTIVVVSTMAEAQQYIDKWGPPDLTTLDLNLPDSRWHETIKQIDKIRGKQGCVLVVSGVVEDGLERKAREHGADAFIAKPFAERGFLGTLRDTFSSFSTVPERYKRFERILQTLTKHLEQMKPLLVFLALTLSAFSQEWNGTVFPSQNDGKLDSLRKSNKILNDSRTGTTPVNMTILLSPITQIIANGEWNGTVFPSQNDNDMSALRKINKILNDARTGTAPLQITGSGGGGGGLVTAVTGTAGRITVTGAAATPVINIDANYLTAPGPIGGTTPDSGIFNRLIVRGAPYPSPGGVIDANAATGVVKLGDFGLLGNSTRIIIDEGASTVTIQGGAGINMTGTLTLNNGLIVTNQATFNGAIVASPANQAVTLSPTGTGIVTINPATLGSINKMTIGATTPSTGAFTTLSASSTVSGQGFIDRLSTPGPIGDGTPSTGAFTNLSASGTVSGAGYTSLFASPPPLGSTAPNTVAATTLAASSTVSGAGFTARFASPGPIGNTSASTVAATTLSASSTVSGQGFIDRLASPGPIGNTSASTVAATTLSASSTVSGAGFVSRFSTPGPIGDGTPSTGAFSTLSASGAVTGAGFTAMRTGSLGITIDGGGSAITTGVKGYLYCPYACTITAATVLADVSGSIVIEVWKDTRANHPPTIADKISASAPMTLSSAVQSQDTTLTGWTVSVSAGDTLAFNVNSASTVTKINAVLTTLK